MGVGAAGDVWWWRVREGGGGQEEREADGEREEGLVVEELAVLKKAELVSELRRLSYCEWNDHELVCKLS